MDFDLKERTVLLTLAGSRAYGTHASFSDVDLKGVCIQPSDYAKGFLFRFEQADKPSHINKFSDLLSEEEKEAASKFGLEGTIYEIRKFFKLASDNNPNILDVLFCRDSDIKYITPIGKKLRDKRDIFLSKKSRFTFCGYAFAQLKRIKTHRSWLLNPPSGKPTRKELGLPEAAKRNWNSYMSWKQNRNPKRTGLEAKYGFDVKHGLHLCRLLKMCKEILETGQVNVYRSDAKELLNILDGKMTYEKLIEHSEIMFNDIDNLYQTSNVLPKKPDIHKINEFCIELVGEML